MKSNGALEASDQELQAMTAEMEHGDGLEQDYEPSPMQTVEALLNARRIWLQGKANAIQMARSARRIGDTGLAEQHLKEAVRCNRGVAAVDAEAAEQDEAVRLTYDRALGRVVEQ